MSSSTLEQLNAKLILETRHFEARIDTAVKNKLKQTFDLSGNIVSEFQKLCDLDLNNQWTSVRNDINNKLSSFNFNSLIAKPDYLSNDEYSILSGYKNLNLMMVMMEKGLKNEKQIPFHGDLNNKFKPVYEEAGKFISLDKNENLHDLMDNLKSEILIAKKEREKEESKFFFKDKQKIEYLKNKEKAVAQFCDFCSNYVDSDWKKILSKNIAERNCKNIDFIEKYLELNSDDDPNDNKILSDYVRNTQQKKKLESFFAEYGAKFVSFGGSGREMSVITKFDSSSLIQKMRAEEIKIIAKNEPKIKSILDEIEKIEKQKSEETVKKYNQSAVYDMPGVPPKGSETTSLYQNAMSFKDMVAISNEEAFRNSGPK